jgi:hypothetical protein
MWFVCPGRGWTRLALVLVGAGAYPVLVSIQSGQIASVVAAGMALAWLALRRGRSDLAALALLPVVLKPQVAVLILPALLVAGYYRTFLVWSAMAVAIAAASIASLGPTGVSALLADLRVEQLYLENQVWTPAFLVGVGASAVVVEVIAAALALFAAWRWRGLGPEVPIVAGYLGSLLAAGYHHSIDFPGLLPAALISARFLPSRWAVAAGCLGIACCWATPRLGPIPLLLLQVAWLVFCAARPAPPRERSELDILTTAAAATPPLRAGRA